MKKIKSVAVFFGGNSYEREVSVVTGVFACNLLKERYDVVPVYVAENNSLYTSEDMLNLKTFKFIRIEKFKKLALLQGGLYYFGKKIKKFKDISCIVNCCHGGFGEDGGLYALARFCKIPITSPNSEISSLFMNKHLAKLAVSSLNINTVQGIRVSEAEYKRDFIKCLQNVENLGFPLIIKPTMLGSSIGIRLANGRDELQTALEYCFLYGGEVVVEKYLENKRDISCAVYFDGERVNVSQAKAVYTGGDVFTFEEKYQKGGGSEIETGDIGDEVKRISKRIYSHFSMRGIVRFDFLYSNGALYFNELNLIPGSLGYSVLTERLTTQRVILCDVIENAMREGMAESVKKSPEILNNSEIIFSTGCKK